jgi:hypothetical protein
MIKRPIAFAIIIAMVFSLTPAHASEAKPGGKCTSLGVTTINMGKKLTCIKFEKKLIWSDSEISKKPQAKAKPKARPTYSPPPAPQGPTSFDDLVEKYQGISYAAWSKSRDKIRNSKKTDVTLKMVIGPGTTLTNKEPIVAIDLVTRLYAGFVQSAEVYFLAFSFEDRDWAVNQMDQILPSAGSQWIIQTACRTKETCWGGGAFFDGANRFLIVEGMGIINTNSTSGSLEAHEFTHIVQQMNMKSARPAREFVYDPWPPTWYWEGQANFSQHATIYFESFDSYTRERRNVSGGIFNKPAFNSTHIQNYFVFNAPLDWQKNYDRYRQYDLGAMFVEILVALKGPDASMEMWKIASTGVNFDVAFERVYGVAFAIALPIMAKAIALQLGQS